MKNFFFLRSACVAAFMLLFAFGCKESEPGNSGGGGQSNTDFVVSKEVLYDRMTITVTPPDDAPQFFMRPYSQRSLPADLTDDALQAFIITEDDFGATLYSDQREISFGGLIGGSKYKLVYFGYDPVNNVATTPLIAEDFNTPEAPIVYDIEVNDVNAFFATATITPNDDNTYYTWMQSKTTYDKNGGDHYGIILNDMSWWQQLADWDAEYGETSTWLDHYLADENVQRGQRELSSYYDIQLQMKWDNEYVVYAYSFDNQGNLQNHVNAVTFSTPAPGTSANTFECEVHQTWTDGVEFTVTPSNNDPYFISIERYDGYVSYYEESEEHDFDDMLLNTLEGMSPERFAARTFTGTQTINTKQLGDALPIYRPNTLYNIIIVGMDNGPSTDYNFFEFTSENSGN